MCLIGTGAAERKGKAAAAGWLCQPERLSEGYFIFDVHNIYGYFQPQFVLNFRVSQLFFPPLYGHHKWKTPGGALQVVEFGRDGRTIGLHG